MKAIYSPEGRRREAEKVGGYIMNLTDSIALEEIDCKDKMHRVLTLINPIITPPFATDCFQFPRSILRWFFFEF
jgi:hypothetical protein